MDNETADVAAPTDVATGEAQNPNIESEQDVEKLRQLNKQLYERAKRAEAEAKDLKSKVPAEAKAPLQTSNQSSSEAVDRLTLKVDGYTKDEIDAVMAAGGLRSLENPVVKAGIEYIRARRIEAERSAEATPSDTVQSLGIRGIKEDDVRKMSVEELEKILPKSN